MRSPYTEPFTAEEQYNIDTLKGLIGLEVFLVIYLVLVGVNK